MDNPSTQGAKTNARRFSTISRLCGKILNRLEDYQQYQSEEQSGFLAGRFTFARLQRYIKEWQQIGKLLVFVDLTTFDTMPISKLLDVLLTTAMSITTINAIEEIYRDATAQVKTGNGLSEKF